MFHLTPAGDANKCEAKQGRCPYGSSDHFPNQKEARQAYESRQEVLFSKIGKLKKPATQHLSYEAHDSAFNAEEHEIDYTPEEVVAKFESDIQGKTFELHEKTNPGEPGLILERLFGKTPDSDPTADLGHVELKTLKMSSIDRPVSLGAVHLSGDSRELRSRFLGQSFQKTLKAGDWVTAGDHYYALHVDRKQRKVRIIIANKSKEFVSTNDFGWSFDDLETKVDKKLNSIAVGLYETNEDSADQRSVTFKNILIGGFTRESMIDKIESGAVSIDFRFSGRYARTTLVAKAEDFADTSTIEKARL